jgi:hypothetical protein
LTLILKILFDFLTNQIGYLALRIEILTNIYGSDFKEAYTQKQVIEIENLRANYFGLNDLSQNTLQDIDNCLKLALGIL